MAIETALLQTASGDADIAYTGRQMRNLVIGSIFSREGVLDRNAGHLAVTQRGSGANMSVDVAVGRAAVFGDDASDQGTYAINSNTVVNVSIPAASTSASRTHRVILRVRDKLENSSWSTYDSIVQVQTDTNLGVVMPPSSIMLALVTTPANATSVTNAMITDLRGRASVGTPWVVGTMSEAGINAAYGGRDSTRPLTWTRNPDGWVFLSGFIRRSGGNTGLAAGTIYYFDGNNGATAMLPSEARPTGIRDVTMMTDLGPCNLAIYQSGAMSFRFKNAETLVQNQTWFSFDGIQFRASA